MVRRDQDDRFGNEDREAVAELISRGEQAELIRVVRRFDSPCVDDDVLRRRGEGDHEREQTERGEPGFEAAGRDRDQPEPDQQLASAPSTRAAARAAQSPARRADR